MLPPLVWYKPLKFRQGVPFGDNTFKLFNLFGRNRFGCPNLGCNDCTEYVTEMAGILHRCGTKILVDEAGSEGVTTSKRIRELDAIARLLDLLTGL